MTTYKIAENIFDRNEYAETWAILDPWGREVGCRLQTYIIEWEIKALDKPWGYELEAAEKHLEELKALGPYVLRCQQTRNNKSYGSGSRARYFHTLAERDKAIAKYLKDGHKRAEQSVAKQAARRVK